MNAVYDPIPNHVNRNRQETSSGNPPADCSNHRGHDPLSLIAASITACRAPCYGLSSPVETRTLDTLAVAIATTGRPAVLTETLREIGRQTSPPDLVLVCPLTEADVDRGALAALPFPVTIVPASAPGLAAQRNVLLRAIGASELVLFIDDDFLLAPTYLAALRALFSQRRDCVIATGHVIADGAVNRGYDVEEGRAILAAHETLPPSQIPCFNAYGCNMAVRWEALRGCCLFDEALPLYAWAEDVDFSRQAARHGAVLKNQAMAGVHLAAKHGRVSGVRFGYSQIANQVYLARKGTLSVPGCLRKAAENVAANLVGAIRGHEPYVDRRGRLAGNLIGIRDVLTGRSAPDRILGL